MVWLYLRGLYITIISVIIAMSGVVFAYSVRHFIPSFMFVQLFGALLGALLSFRRIAKINLIKNLRLCVLVYLLSNIAIFLVPNLSSYNVFWFITGLAIGNLYLVLPLYVTEIFITSLNSRFVYILQIFAISAIIRTLVITYHTNFPSSRLVDNTLICIITSALFLCISILLPQSPRWLISHGKREKAIKTLNSLYGPNYHVRFAEINSLSAGYTNSLAISYALPALFICLGANLLSAFYIFGIVKYQMHQIYIIPLVIFYIAIGIVVRNKIVSSNIIYLMIVLIIIFSLIMNTAVIWGVHFFK